MAATRLFASHLTASKHPTITVSDNTVVIVPSA
jgi:phosphopantothenate synthetase